MFVLLASVPPLVIAIFGATAVLGVAAGVNSRRGSEESSSVILWSAILYAGAVAIVVALWLREQL